MKYLIVFLMLLISSSAYAVGSPGYLPDGNHPRIWLTTAELLTLASIRDSSDTRWTALEAWCDSHINDAGYDTHPANQATLDLTNWGGDNNYTLGYRMSGWARHLYNFSLAYQVLKQPGTAQNTTKAATYASRVRTLLIDGISATLSAGEETGNGLHALRVASLHDATINSSEATALGIGSSGYKLGYASRFLAAVPVAYDWIYDTLSTADKTELTGMMLRWVDWSRGKRSAYNNGVLVSGVRYHEDTDGDCTGVNNCTSVGSTLQYGYAYDNVANNFGSGFASMFSLIGVATYGDYPEDDTYLSYIKTYLTNNVVSPLGSDILHAGGDSPEGWNYGGGFIYSAPGLYGYYTATEDPAIPAMTWQGDLVRAAAHRVGGDFLTVPLWGYWTGVPYAESRIEPVTTFVGIEQKLFPTSDESKLGQYLLDTAAYTQSLDEWKGLLFTSASVTAVSPVTLGEPLSYVALGNGLYASRSSWNDANAVHVTARLEGKVTTAHEGYDEGHITLARGTDVLLGHQNSVGDAPPSNSFNTIVFNNASHPAKNVPTQPAIDRQAEGGTYSYVSGDITGSWWYQWGDDYAQLFRRSVLHIRPNFVVVSDMTQSTTSRGLLKDFYTQFVADPAIAGTTVSAVSGSSKVYMENLYPAGSYTETNPATGYYRVKFTPTASQEYDQFLTVFEATTSAGAQTATSLISATGGRGALIGATAAMFTSSPTAANISTLTYTVDATTHYVSDLPVYTDVAVTRGGTPIAASPINSGSAGIIEFTAASGSVEYVVTAGTPATCETVESLCTNATDCNTYWSKPYYYDGACQSVPETPTDTCATLELLCISAEECLTYWSKPYYYDGACQSVAQNPGITEYSVSGEWQ